MNELYEKVRAFAAQIKDDETDREDTAVLILALDSKGMSEGESSTSTLIKGKSGKLIELMLHTILRDSRLKSLLGEAVKFDLIRSFLSKEEDAPDDMPAKGKPDPADVAAN